MTGLHWAMDAAEEIIERLARDFTADAIGEAQFLETCQIPRKLAGHLAVAALSRAAVRVQGMIDRESGVVKAGD